MPSIFESQLHFGLVSNSHGLKYHWNLVANQANITERVLHHNYAGNGTDDDPYIVEFLPDDLRNPMTFSAARKWFITSMVTLSVFAVALVSSAYSGASKEIMAEFGASQEVTTLGVSLFVLGFAVGPLLWAPLSELYGRQIWFGITYALLAAFTAGAAFSNSITTLVILRFFAGMFGASPLTNAGGVVADLFTASHRGIAMSIFCAAPFLGPVLGPLVGGFVSETVGWRWVLGIMAIFTGTIWVVGSISIPETYAPHLLRQRAASLSTSTGKTYVSILEKRKGKVSPARTFKIALSRPMVLLFVEPAVLAASTYMSILYGTLYMLFGAFPVVFQQQRGWSPGIGGLSFMGVAVGMIIGVVYAILDNKRYIRLVANHYKGGLAPPEARLPPAIVGSIFLPLGLFWFSWTNAPDLHWSICIVGSAFFGFGMVLVFLACLNYLIDAYTIYAASVLAASATMRSLFGAAFPMFTAQMYRKLGTHWASSIPGFLTIACLPFPVLMYIYGEQIRMRCKYAALAAEEMKVLERVDESVGKV